MGHINMGDYYIIIYKMYKIIILLLLLLLVPLPFNTKVSYKLVNFISQVLIKCFHHFKITPLNVKVCEDNLLQFDSIIKTIGIEYWLSEGTALGAIRDGAIIPWDDDVDVSFMYKYKDIFINKAIPELQRAGFKVSYITNKGNFFVFVRNGERMDIDIVQKDGYCNAALTKHANFTHQCNDILPYLNDMNKINFLGREFTVPNKGYLEYLYGDWKTPMKHKELVIKL